MCVAACSMQQSAVWQRALLHDLPVLDSQNVSIVGAMMLQLQICAPERGSARVRTRAAAKD